MKLLEETQCARGLKPNKERHGSEEERSNLRLPNGWKYALERIVAIIIFPAARSP
jgi:hypothetical protein